MSIALFRSSSESALCNPRHHNWSEMPFAIRNNKDNRNISSKLKGHSLPFEGDSILFIIKYL